MKIELTDEERQVVELAIDLIASESLGNREPGGAFSAAAERLGVRFPVNLPRKDHHVNGLRSVGSAHIESEERIARLRKLLEAANGQA